MTLQLLTTKTYNGIEFDCYVEPNQTDKGAFWATRTQIGELLGYEHPATAIKNIHERNKDRLDRFSTQLKMSQVEGGRKVEREVTLYDFKGLLEICRYSNQPKANAIMDWLWEIADEIRRTGSYSINQPKPKLLEQMKAAKAVFDAAGIKGNQLALALDNVYASYTGQSALETGNVMLKAPEDKPQRRNKELWQHIVSTFAPDEWFTTSALMRTLPRNTLCPRQVRRYLADFVAKKMLCRRGCLKSSEYSRLKKY